MNADFKAALEEMGMNVDNTVKRFMGNETLYLKFLNKYQADQSVASIQQYIAEQNAEEVFKSAHTLKGVAANLGLDPIAQHASDIVELFRGKTQFSEVDTDRVNALNEELKSKHDALLKLLAAQQ
ncbi:MAG: Hpt domain-containing protein [Eubacterium sp.]|nr:Hpt domain-containing protein [Eubacterium sp.]MCM1215745.1 Hpt domain-containing protein [Lachnospiraceae bacterium]MCM1304364.1 Hpt domain-containing protein [Butyrivibrio sp.]MCM1343844.1 Hpt domain-containing protein [Muribaculaceae bacterium]MCM1238309.1 Hpt domain-containing protein [Lachnospiraceae bacterium]